jgi:L-ascorbate 6-phosphate lactonase
MTPQNLQCWDESFLKQVEGQTIGQGVLIWALSGPSFAIRTPRAMLYIDPFLGIPSWAELPLHRATSVPLDPARVSLADAVVISHDHYDHCHKETLQALAAHTAAQFYGPTSVAKLMAEYGVPAGRIHALKPGDQFTLQDATITVWPGYDKGEPLAVCYLIEAGGVRILFTGDSSAGPAFDEIAAQGDLDIAMLSFGRTWYMSEAELLDAAARLRCKLLLPYHWELWYGHTGNPVELGRLAERRQVPFGVELLLVGENVHYLPGGKYSRG